MLTFLLNIGLKKLYQTIEIKGKVKGGQTFFSRERDSFHWNTPCVYRATMARNDARGDARKMVERGWKREKETRTREAAGSNDPSILWKSGTRERERERKRERRR